MSAIHTSLWVGKNKNACSNNKNNSYWPHHDQQYGHKYCIVSDTDSAWNVNFYEMEYIVKYIEAFRGQYKG